jgi:glycosyltransferase involved in cell wall biosynthesis
MKKVLIITYYWPPSGGAGVQRWLKFSKYLPEFGWEPYILTVDPKFAAYPVIDESLMTDLPDKVKVFTTTAINFFKVYSTDSSRIPTAGFANSVNNTLKGKIMRFIRGNFFIPDPRRGWNRYAFKKACEIIESEDIIKIITTSPPHSTQLIGLKLKKKFPQITWIADLRDPWTEIYYYDQFYPTVLSKIIDSSYEKAVLKGADRIITIGPSLKATFVSKTSGIDSKTEVITNGYDEDDFKFTKESSPDVFTITYTGTLTETYPIAGFLKALKLFSEEGNNFILRFVGTVPENMKGTILKSVGNSSVEFISYTDHKKIVRYLLDSSILLLIIPEHKSNKSIITGKLFEYIASGKPILCLGPEDNDGSVIIKENEVGETFIYNDYKGISEYLTSVFSGTNKYVTPASKLFSRRELTEKVIHMLIQ